MAEFDKVWSNMSVQTAALFMRLAAADQRGKPMSITEAHEASGMTLASASRNIQALEQRRENKDSEPLNLVEVRVHPTQYRAKVIVLTTRGKHFYNRILELMEG
jgi:DNA-binding MarR family transcriptional regulator